MNDKQAANTAIANLDGYNIKGQRMRVEVSVHVLSNGSISAVNDGQVFPKTKGINEVEYSIFKKSVPCVADKTL